MIQMPGTYELIIFAVILLILFGSRVPALMRSLGSSVSEFKKGVRDGEESGKDSLDSGKS